MSKCWFVRLSRLSRLSFLVCSFWSLKPQRLETWESASRQKDEHQGCWFWNGFFTGKCTVYVCLLGMKLFICFTKTQCKYLLNLKKGVSAMIYVCSLWFHFRWIYSNSNSIFINYFFIKSFLYIYRILYINYLHMDISSLKNSRCSI